MPPGRQTKRRQEQLTDEVKRIRRADPANLTCADCPVRATPCVVTDHGIFVCTDCGGVHRQHSHRVKSISIATFTEQEVERLRNTGNAISNAKYLAKHKEGKDTPLPKEGDRKKIEEFILQKYVRQEWYKENPRPPKRKKGRKGRRRRSSTVDEDDDDEDEDDAPRRSSQYDLDPQPPQTQMPAVIEEQPQPTQQPIQPKNEPDDLLSFDFTPQTAAPVTQPAAADPVDNWDAFGTDFSTPQPAPAAQLAAAPPQTDQNWDPWATTATAAPAQPAQPAPAAQQASDPLWGNFFQQPQAAAPTNQNDTIFGMDPEPQPPQPVVEEKPPEPEPKKEYADPFAGLYSDTNLTSGGAGPGGMMGDSMSSLGSGMNTMMSPDTSLSSIPTAGPGMNPAAPANPYASQMGAPPGVGYPQPAVPATGYGPGAYAYPTYPQPNQFAPPQTSYGPPGAYPYAAPVTASVVPQGYPGGMPMHVPPAQPAQTASDNPFL